MYIWLPMAVIHIIFATVFLFMLGVDLRDKRTLPIAIIVSLVYPLTLIAIFIWCIHRKIHKKQHSSLN